MKPALILALFALSAQADPLKVLVWNTERGARPYGPDGKERVLGLIRDSGADVVLWQESYPIEDGGPKLAAWVAEKLGWKSWQGESPHLAVATRFEIEETYFHQPWHGLGARLRDPQGRAFLAWSVWLDHRSPPQWETSDRPDASDAEILACETEKSNRFAQAQALLDRLDELGQFDAAVPLLVGGDWNTSSHLDWTAEAVPAHPWRRPLALPVSRLMDAAGFADTFRVLHPGPATHPGNTWTPRPDPRDNGKPDPPERIDRLYLRQPVGAAGLRPLRATVFPLDPAAARAPREQAKFPSDHAAVLIEFEWVTAAPAGPGTFTPGPGRASPGIDHRPPPARAPEFQPVRIAWGSCYQETRVCPMLGTLAAEKPDLYLALGDNIYGDTLDMDVLRRKYRRLARQPDWQTLVRQCPVIATWDDHDYGADDSGADYPPKAESREIFLDFFDEPADSPRRQRDGIHTSYHFGPEGREIQIIMLDLRTHRSPQAKEPEAIYRGMGRYRPLNEDETQVMLGEDQWRWLEEELRKPARLRLIGHSTQFATSHNGFETWTLFPREQERFLELIRRTRAEGVILLSGDTHWAEFTRLEAPGLYPIYDLTASALNQSWDPIGPNTRRLGMAYGKPNAGLMEIDWDAGIVKARIIDETGTDRLALAIHLDELRFHEPAAAPSPAGTWRSAFGDMTLTHTDAGWTARYPNGHCELAEADGALEGVWTEGERSGRCRFEPSRCGRFLFGSYGRGDAPAILAWPAWRPDAPGFHSDPPGGAP